MSDDHHCSFKSGRQQAGATCGTPDLSAQEPTCGFVSRVRILCISACTLLVAACSGADLDLKTGITPPPPVRATAVVATPPQPTKPVPAAPHKQAVARPREKSIITPEPTITPARAPHITPDGSAWCTYLTETAAADATVLRAPTVSASINKDGNKGVAVNYDLSNIAKAELLDAAAQAKCRRYAANAALNRMAIASPNVLSRAGYRAKADVISRHARKLRAIKTLVRRELETGTFDRTQTSRLLLAADQIIADGAQANSESEKRQGFVAYDLDNLKELSKQLHRAETELADINSHIRSADAVAIKLSGGWRESGKEAGAIIPKSDFYGGVNFSVKLGAFNPARFEHERAATLARLRAHQSEPGSIFWKLKALEQAQISGRAGIVNALNTMISSRNTALRQKRHLPASDPAFLYARYEAEIAIIKLDADIAGSRATLRQIDRNLRQLRRLRY